MQDDSSVLIALGVAILAAVFVIVIVTSVRPAGEAIQEAIQEAIASGRVTYGMSEKQVIQVWGDPDALTTKVTETPMGSLDQLSSALEGLSSALKGLSQSRLERALAGKTFKTLYTYTIWTYRNPWRTVTFDDHGYVVVDWFPKD
jgi:hypothetical protein